MSKRKASEVHIATIDQIGNLKRETRQPTVNRAKRWVLDHGATNTVYILYRVEHALVKKETVRTQLVVADTLKEPA